MNFRSTRLLTASLPIALYSNRQIRSLSDSVIASTTDITLYQYKICPYCSRPKTLLDYLKVPYEAVEVNPLTKSQLSFTKEYKKVPIMLMNGEVVNDSKAILDALQLALSSNPEMAAKISKIKSNDT